MSWALVANKRRSLSSSTWSHFWAFVFGIRNSSHGTSYDFDLPFCTSTLNNGLVLLRCLFTLLSISQNERDKDFVSFPLDCRRVLNTWIARLSDVWVFYSLSKLYRDIWFIWLNYYPMVRILKFCTCTLINAQFELHSIHLYFLTLWIFLDSNWFQLTFFPNKSKLPRKIYNTSRIYRTYVWWNFQIGSTYFDWKGAITITSWTKRKTNFNNAKISVNECAVFKVLYLRKVNTYKRQHWNIKRIVNYLSELFRKLENHLYSIQTSSFGMLINKPNTSYNVPCKLKDCTWICWSSNYILFDITLLVLSTSY